MAESNGSEDFGNSEGQRQEEQGQAVRHYHFVGRYGAGVSNLVMRGLVIVALSAKITSKPLPHRPCAETAMFEIGTSVGRGLSTASS